MTILLGNLPFWQTKIRTVYNLNKLEEIWNLSLRTYRLSFEKEDGRNTGWTDIGSIKLLSNSPDQYISSKADRQNN